MNKLFFLLFLLFIPIPVYVAQPIVYENSHIILIGNCQTIVTTDGKWNNWFYKGDLETVGIANIGFLIVIIYKNNSIIYHSILSTGRIFLRHPSGVFIWSAKGFEVRYFLPFIYINAYAQKSYINLGEK